MDGQKKKIGRPKANEKKKRRKVIKEHKMRK